jgi:putative transposase
MEKHSKDVSGESSEFLGAGWFDPIEVAIRQRVRGFIEELVDAELDEALGRLRYSRPAPADDAGGTAGYRHGRRDRRLLGSFGPVTISVPRARLNEADGTRREWHSEVLPRYARMTKQVEAVIAGAYLSAPTRAGCGGHWERCSGVRSARKVTVETDEQISDIGLSTRLKATA